MRGGCSTWAGAARWPSLNNSVICRRGQGSVLDSAQGPYTQGRQSPDRSPPSRMKRWRGYSFETLLRLWMARWCLIGIKMKP
jgi:hypothetical protein